MSTENRQWLCETEKWPVLWGEVHFNEEPPWALESTAMYRPSPEDAETYPGLLDSSTWSCYQGVDGICVACSYCGGGRDDAAMKAGPAQQAVDDLAAAVTELIAAMCEEYLFRPWRWVVRAWHRLVGGEVG